MRTASAALISGLIMTLAIALSAHAGEEATVLKGKCKAEETTGDRAGEKKPPKQPEWIGHFQKALSKRVNVDFKDAPLSEVITFIQHVSDVDMIIDPKTKVEAKKKITIKAEKIAVAEVLDSILKIAGLERCYKDRTLFITAKKPEKKKEEKALPRPDAPRRDTPKKKEEKPALEFIETPASQVVDYVVQKGKLNVVIDPKATKLLETPISFKAKGMKLGQVLDWALRLSRTEKRSINGVIYIRPKKGTTKLEVKRSPPKGTAKN